MATPAKKKPSLVFGTVKAKPAATASPTPAAKTSPTAKPAEEEDAPPPPPVRNPRPALNTPAGDDAPPPPPEEDEANVPPPPPEEDEDNDPPPPPVNPRPVSVAGSTTPLAGGNRTRSFTDSTADLNTSHSSLNSPGSDSGKSNRPAFAKPKGFANGAKLSANKLPPPPPKPVNAMSFKFFEPDAAENVDLVEDPQNPERQIVKGGTLEKLVGRLTYEKYPDPNYLLAFLLTYRSFTSPGELLNLLILRYTMEPPPEAVTVEAQEKFRTDILTPVRLRVFNVLKNWVQQHFYDFEDNDPMLRKLMDFIDNTMALTGMENAAQQLRKFIAKGIEGIEQSRNVVFTTPPPRVLFSMTTPFSDIRFMDVPAEEIARQATLIEYDLYKSIKPWECLGQGWAKTKPGEPSTSPNILAMIHRFNAVSQWVATEIVSTESLAARQGVLARFIQIAEKCRELNNFNAMMEIISGLQQTPVFRLKQTWAGVNSKLQDQLDEHTAILARDNNYKALRARLKQINPPCIPYLGMFLTDLTFVEDGNKDFIPDTKLINFVKRRKVAQVISQIQQYQQTPYCLESLPNVKEYLLNRRHLPEEECYKLSLEREARATTTSAAPGASPGARPPAPTPGPKPTRPSTAGGSSPTTAPAGGAKPDDIPPPPPPEEEDDYRFSAADSPQNVLVDNDNKNRPKVIAGTVDKLVEKLTNEKNPDPDMLRTFMLTYWTFTTPEDLLQLLIQRYNVPLPKNVDAAALEDFRNKKQIPIRLRVFTVLKHWVSKYFHDFIENVPLQTMFYKFCEQTMTDGGMDKAGDVLSKTLQKVLETRGRDQYGTSQKKEPLPKVQMPPNITAGQIKSFTEIPAVELARQLTLGDHEVFKNISAFEAANWGNTLQSPNATKARARFDKVVEWIKDEVVAQPDVAGQTAMVGASIRLAKEAYDLHNFNLVMAVLLGIQSPEVHVLKAMWAGVPSDVLEEIVRLKNIFSSMLPTPTGTPLAPNAANDLAAAASGSGHPRYREILRKSTPPCIPYLAVMQADINYIQNNVEDTVKGTLINFNKRHQLAAIIRELQMYQTAPYRFQRVDAAQEFFVMKGMPPVEWEEPVTPSLSETKHRTSIGSSSRRLSTRVDDIQLEELSDETRSMPSRSGSTNSLVGEQFGEAIQAARINVLYRLQDDTELQDSIKLLADEVSDELGGKGAAAPPDSQGGMESSLESLRNSVLSMREEITDAAALVGTAMPITDERLLQAQRGIVGRRFTSPKHQVEDACVVDADGAVYGTPGTKVTLYKATRVDSGNAFLVTVLSTLDGSDVSAFMRAYALEPSNKECGKAIILLGGSGNATPLGLQIAQSSNVELMW